MLGKKKIRVAINGFGRIGRAFFRETYSRKDMEVVAINDLGSHENLAYLLQYDTVYGKAPFPVSTNGNNLVVDKREVNFYSEKDPTLLPWGELKIDAVVESTGIFDDYEKAKAHLTAGARRVVITAPVKNEHELGKTIQIGINDELIKTCPITSNASCTTASASPVIAILDEAIGIEKALLTTTHAYTATQSLVDSPVPHADRHSDLRRGRAASQNIVPSSTGSAIAVTKAYEPLAGKFDGISLRVPVSCGSISDITFVAKRETTVEEINAILEKASKDSRWSDVFAVAHDQLVSSDIIGDTHASIAQLDLTRVIGGNLVKVFAWYDNEAGYTHSLVLHVLKSGNV